MYLVEGGVPWDVAVAASPTRRLAMVIVRGELRGGTWDWKSRSWGVKK
jgi:hypothetical protein